MLRALPVSIIVHLAVLGLLAAWGGHVPPTPLETQRILRVQIARLPAPQPQVSQPLPEPEPELPVPEPEPEPEPPPPVRPPDPELPPKEVPRSADPAPPPPPADPAPPRPSAQEQRPQADEPQPAVAGGGPAVSGTDVDFPFAWYLNRVEGIIARQWQPRQLGFRESTSRNCVVHFMIDRAGQVSQVTLVRSSGVTLFDREALRAVRSGRLPPLPPRFPHRALGVTFIFNLESGI